jgi:flagellar basal-body rod protein FlgB
MIQGMFNGGAMSALQRTVQFTTARHKVLTNNIANLSTPYFKPADLDPARFQSTLRDAIKQRRQSLNPTDGPLDLRDTRQMSFTADGIEARPSPSNENILFHDRNNRDLERTMQDLAENTLAHNTSIELLRNQFEMLKLAIRARV